MAGLKIVIEELDENTYSIKATDGGKCIDSIHNNIFPKFDIINDINIVSMWLKSDLNKLRSPVKELESNFALCLECETEMWGGVPFKEGSIYKVQPDNTIYDCSNFQTKRELEWHGNIAISNSTKSKFILVKNFERYTPFVKTVMYNGKIVCLEQIGKPKDNTFIPGEIISFHNGKIVKQTLNGFENLFSYSSFKQIQRSFAARYKFAEIIDEGTIYNDIFICVESKNEQFKPGILYFVRDNELLSLINITVHNKEEVIKNLSKAGVTVKKVNWE